jgi:hypothetical protein
MFRLLLALILACTACSAIAQDGVVLQPQVTENPQIFGDNQFSDDRLEVLLSQAIKDADISEFKRGRLERIMKGNGPLRKMQKKAIMERARAELVESDAIGVDDSGNVIAALDWNAILKILIEQVLPIILKLLIGV